MMKLLIYHNPDCKISSDVVSILTAEGCDVCIIDITELGWTRPKLLFLLLLAGLTPSSALSQQDAAALGARRRRRLSNDKAIIKAMLAEPRLVVAPIVCCAAGVRLCRPAHLAIDLLRAASEHPDAGSWFPDHRQGDPASGPIHPSFVARSCQRD